jgi:BirA family biotin operon repressor/biotin-[acetyl-CoA-carboxylase] ligase
MLPHALSNLPFVERFYSHRIVASTNDCARSLTEFPRSGMFVIQADRQTAGRGRSGAPYFSGKGGLWATILAPLPSMDDHFRHNRALSVAVAEASEAVTSSISGDHVLSITIKWPNDLYLGGKKLCGILLENHPARSDMLVMGFGLNVNIPSTGFPYALRPLVTSLSIETGQKVSRSRLLEAVISRYYANLAIDSNILHGAYLTRLYRRGEPVETAGKKGIFDGVEPDGKLRLLINREVHYAVSGHLRFTDNPGRLPDA